MSQGNNRDEYGRFVLGHQNIRKGTKNTKEHCRKISLGKMGHEVSKEQRERHSKLMKGRRCSPKTEFKKGIIPWNKGKTGIYTNDIIEAQKKLRSTQIFPYRDTIIEKVIQNELSIRNIKFEKHKSLKDGHGFYHQVDIFIEPNICVEIDGDYWHANPLKYNPYFKIFKNPKIIYAIDIWEKDRKTNQKLTTLGYKIIRLWESDIKKDVSNVINYLIKNLNKVERFG